MEKTPETLAADAITSVLQHIMFAGATKSQLEAAENLMVGVYQLGRYKGQMEEREAVLKELDSIDQL